MTSPEKKDPATQALEYDAYVRSNTEKKNDPSVLSTLVDAMITAGYCIKKLFERKKNDDSKHQRSRPFMTE